MPIKTRPVAWFLVALLPCAAFVACGDDDAAAPVARVDADAGHDAASDVVDASRPGDDDGGARLDAGPADATPDAPSGPPCIRNPNLKGYFDSVYANYYQRAVGEDCRVYFLFDPLYLSGPNNGEAAFATWKEGELRPWYESFLGCADADAGADASTDAGGAPRTPVAIVPYATPPITIYKADYETLVDLFVRSAAGGADGGTSVLFTAAEQAELRAALLAVEDLAVTDPAGVGYSNADTESGCNLETGATPRTLRRAPR